MRNTLKESIILREECKVAGLSLKSQRKCLNIKFITKLYGGAICWRLRTPRVYSTDLRPETTVIFVFKNHPLKHTKFLCESTCWYTSQQKENQSCVNYNTMINENMHPIMKTEDLKRFISKIREGENNPIMVAAQKEDREGFLLTVEPYGGNLNSTTKSGLTILHFAALNIHHGLDNIAFLNDPDFSKKDIDGEEPIHYAVRVKNYNFANSVLNLRDPMAHNLLHFFIMENDLKFAKVVNDEVGGIYIENIKGKTLLHYAAQYAGREMCEWLVKKGLYVEAKTKKKYSVLHFALLNDVTAWAMENADFFIAKNPSILNYRDEFYQTPLHRALFHQDIPLATFLLSKGACIWVKWKRNKNLLHFCVQKRKLASAKFVHSMNNQLIKEVCHEGMTALHIAARNRDVRSFVWLLENGVDFQALDMKNRSALNYLFHRRTETLNMN
ncbi:Hypothetical predicted protein [Cloeon dipterum]|uniref:Uncharacterized protein n=1 Tax=Cloeon dipterum TaxID=197152 RepID=A0A8S1E1D5_9INSE|nr:Hypothetical predicted protein [Cloeon dipterum]